MSFFKNVNSLPNLSCTIWKCLGEYFAWLNEHDCNRLQNIASDAGSMYIEPVQPPTNPSLMHLHSETAASLIAEYVHWILIRYRQLKARRALSLFKDDLLWTRRVLSPYSLYSNNALLVLNGTSLNIDSALLVLNWWYHVLTHSEQRPQIFIPKRK